MLLVIAIVLLTGCGKKVFEEDIKKDFSEYIGTELEIEKLEMTKSATESKAFYTSIDVIYNDGYYKYTEKYGMCYYKFNEGWMLDYVSKENENEWEKEPIAGVSKQRIAALLDDESIEYENETYLLGDIEETDIEIISQNSDLDSMKDNVVFQLTFLGTYTIYTAEISADLIIDNNDWNFEKIETTQFTYEPKPEYVLNKSEDEMLSDMNTVENIYIGLIKATEINVKNKELVFVRRTRVEKILKYIVEAEILLDYDYVVARCNATLEYTMYDGEWKISSVSLGDLIGYEKDLVSGTYKGNYGINGKHYMEITIKLSDKEVGVIEGSYAYKYQRYANQIIEGVNEITGNIVLENGHVLVDDLDHNKAWENGYAIGHFDPYFLYDDTQRILYDEGDVYVYE